MWNEKIRIGFVCSDEVRIVLSRKVEESVVAIRYALAGDDLIGSVEWGSGLTCLGESGVVLFR